MELFDYLPIAVMVVLGNPPYNGFAGVAVDEERGLSDAYRTTKRAPRRAPSLIRWELAIHVSSIWEDENLVLRL